MKQTETTGIVCEPAAEYVIRNVTDFRIVPADRLETCLHEFEVWIAAARLTMALTDDLAGLPEEFVWIDDGKATIDVRIQAGEEVIHILSGTIRKRKLPPKD